MKEKTIKPGTVVQTDGTIYKTTIIVLGNCCKYKGSLDCIVIYHDKKINKVSDVLKEHWFIEDLMNINDRNQDD